MGIYQGKQENELINCSKHESTVIDLPCKIGKGTVIWHWTHIRENCKIGQNCSIGQCCYVANDVTIGDNVKIQNGVSIPEGVIIEDNVFIGTNVCFSNIRYPRAYNKNRKYEVTLIKEGATIGANSTLFSGITVGRDSMVGVGSTVTRSVPAKKFVVGNPAVFVEPRGLTYLE